MQLLATVAVALAALSHCASSWTITPSNVTQPEVSRGRHQTHVKVWTVTGLQPLTAITIQETGNVFIDYDATLNVAATEAPVAINGSGSGSGLDLLAGVVSLDKDKVLAKVVLSGNSSTLLNEIEVIERDGALNIHFKNVDYLGYGYVLTEVFVGEKEALSELAIHSAASIYVSENVVTASNASAEVKITTYGDGDIFVTAPSTAFTVKSLTATITGSGTIQLSADSVTLGGSLESRITGDGDIAFVANKVDVTNKIASTITGEGHIFVQAATIQTFKLDSTVTGDGIITAATNGTTVEQDVSITGDGTVATGSIAAVDTTVRLLGTGSALVQTSYRLVVPQTNSNGTIQYVGATPLEITDGRTPRPATNKPKKSKHHHFHHLRRWFSRGKHDEDDDNDSEDEEHQPRINVTQATENKYDKYTLRAPPLREPAFLMLELLKDRRGDNPKIQIAISIFGEDIGDSLVTNTQALAVHVQKQHRVVRGLFFMGFVAVALAAVAITLHKLVARQRRREYQPLL